MYVMVVVAVLVKGGVTPSQHCITDRVSECSVEGQGCLGAAVWAGEKQACNGSLQAFLPTAYLPTPSSFTLPLPLQSLLRFVCDAAQRQADPRLAGRAVMPFYAVLSCELLTKVKAVDEPLLT